MFTKMRKKIRNTSPIRMIAISFLILIITGAILLTLPISSESGTFTNPVDALFTATSASCVTGLVIYDTETHWSLFGEIVIIALIQIGGLGMITFVTFFTILFKRKLGFRDLSLARETTGSESARGARTLLKAIVGITLICELIGALLLAFRFCPDYGFAKGMYTSVFLAISAYCNAGFDILGPEMASMSTFNGDFLVSSVICGLVIIGGIGFIVYIDVFNHFKTKQSLMTHSKIVLIGVLVLLISGTVLFLALEWNNTLTDMSFFEKLNAAFMQSVFARTAGFFSVPLNELHKYTKIILMVLMFIGGAPGSTASGVKITAVTVLIFTILCVMRGKENTEIDNHKVTHTAVYKALTIVACGFVVVFFTLSVILFSSGEAFSTIDAAFEAVSAFSTVGTTCGITADLNTISKIAVIITMFIGRVGPISLSLAITKKTGMIESNEVLPEAKIIAA